MRGETAEPDIVDVPSECVELRLSGPGLLARYRSKR